MIPEPILAFQDLIFSVGKLSDKVTWQGMFHPKEQMTDHIGDASQRESCMLEENMLSCKSK